MRAMKLLRVGPLGQEIPALLDEDEIIRDLSNYVPDWTGQHLRRKTIDRITALDPSSLPAVAAGMRIGPCVGRPGKFICIGLNYSDHAAEAGMDVPPYPIVFFKATSAVTGPYDDVEIPKGSTRTDWEVELGVVIGEPAKYVGEADALDHVAGYCVVNDLSERTLQLERGGQWVKGKSHDTFGPIGPWLVTSDEIADPQDLGL
jgi:2-keto-4-pentenoate hydratase/2-oxohepta-3-ene-1,7-dioic acid hydratase in catechol pathway